MSPVTTAHDATHVTVPASVMLLEKSDYRVNAPFASESGCMYPAHAPGFSYLVGASVAKIRTLNICWETSLLVPSAHR